MIIVSCELAVSSPLPASIKYIISAQYVLIGCDEMWFTNSKAIALHKMRNHCVQFTIYGLRFWWHVQRIFVDNFSVHQLPIVHGFDVSCSWHRRRRRHWLVLMYCWQVVLRTQQFEQVPWTCQRVSDWSRLAWFEIKFDVSFMLCLANMKTCATQFIFHLYVYFLSLILQWRVVKCKYVIWWI